jgi:hypothetical protein
MSERCLEWRATLDMLQARGTSTFSRIAGLLYGRTGDAFHVGGPSTADLGRDLASRLERIERSGQLPPDELTMDAHEAAAWLQARIDKVFDEDRVRVEVSDEIVAQALAGSQPGALPGRRPLQRAAVAPPRGPRGLRPRRDHAERPPPGDADLPGQGPAVDHDQPGGLGRPRRGDRVHLPPDAATTHQRPGRSDPQGRGRRDVPGRLPLVRRGTRPGAAGGLRRHDADLPWLAARRRALPEGPRLQQGLHPGLQLPVRRDRAGSRLPDRAAVHRQDRTRADRVAVPGLRGRRAPAAALPAAALRRPRRVELVAGVLRVPQRARPRAHRGRLRRRPATPSA